MQDFIEILDEHPGLPDRPLQNIEGRFHAIKVGRGSEAGIVAVNSTLLFKLGLTPNLQDSWNEIGLGPYALQTDFLGFRQYLYGVTLGGAGDDINAYMMDVKERYGKWRDELKGEPRVLDYCHDICHDARSLSEVFGQGRRYYSGRQAFMFGIAEYSRVNRMDRKYIR